MGSETEESARWLSHDADLLLEARAPSAERLFVAAGRAVVEAMTDRPPMTGGTRRSVRLDADDLETLFVAWLNEIVFLVTAEGFLPARYPSMKIGATSLHAEIDGASAGAETRVVREIKAATYHRLVVTEDVSGWTARVLLDV